MGCRQNRRARDAWTALALLAPICSDRFELMRFPPSCCCRELRTLKTGLLKQRRHDVDGLS